MKGKQIQLTNIQTTTQAIGLVLQTLADTGPTTDWDEQAFSAARGWPVTVSFHQDRMVIGGSRDLPNGLWLSKTGQSFNFESAPATMTRRSRSASRRTTRRRSGR